MTDVRAPSAPPPASDAVHTNPFLPVGASNGARTLFWRIAVMVVAVVMVVGAAQSPDSGNDLQGVAALGWALGALALPLVLIGSIAVGVRMGLRDHERDRG
jgi:hypothetical protein